LKNEESVFIEGELNMSLSPYQSSLVKLWNFISKNKHRENKHALSVFEEIIKDIERKSGNDAWKQGQHIEAMSRLLESINDTRDLHPFGRFYVKSFFTELLSQRQALEGLWLQNPRISNDERITKPVIILGLPRSGTSFVFNLLAQDPSHRFLSNWETTVSQIPPEKHCNYLQDPRRKKGKLLVKFQDYLAPSLKNIHEFHLDGPEECTPILMQGFSTQAFAGMFDAPEYSTWLNTVSQDENYQHHKKVLQTLQWKYPGQRWLLKSPDHLAGIDSILKIYPDACFIHLHRDPVQSVTSWASLNQVFRSIYMKSVDPKILGEQVLDRLGNDMDNYILHRKKYKPEQFFDLYYQDLIHDPIKSIEEIYQHFSLDFSAVVSQKMKKFLAKDRKKTRSHQYSAEDFSLNSGLISERFNNYIDTFNVPIVK